MCVCKRENSSYKLEKLLRHESALHNGYSTDSRQTDKLIRYEFVLQNGYFAD